MTIDIKAPTFPESVQDGTVATWHKQAGDAVSRDELIVDIETDKVVLEVVAPSDGTIMDVIRQEGDTVQSGEVIAVLDDTAAPAAESGGGEKTEEAAGDKSGGDDKEKKEAEKEPEESAKRAEPIASPSAQKLANEREIDLADVEGTGKGGRITREDVQNYQPPEKPGPTKPATTERTDLPPEQVDIDRLASGERIEKRVPMTRMRARIAERLLQVTQNTAMLTTFNEADMHRIMNLRNQFKEQFAEVHGGTRLGFMGFFVKASVEALKRYPSVNASIDGTDVVYHAYQDIGVAVSTDKGLVVPVLRNADQMSLAEIEQGIIDFATKAKNNKLSIEEMTGGTFTITNGGVYGSLQSTPILNPPQTAILGMHTIKERPVAEKGEVVIRPMMNLALSYDHRLIDGREAVQFLVAIKEMIENPAKILLEI